MPCVPCQVILWDERMKSMLDGVTKLAEIKLMGGNSPMTADWGRRWYDFLESRCAEMEAMLDELTGTAAPATTVHSHAPAGDAGSQGT